MATRRSEFAPATGWGAIAFVSMLLLDSVSTFGQASTGAIVGRAHDASGAVMAGVWWLLFYIYAQGAPAQAPAPPRALPEQTSGERLPTTTRKGKA